MHMNFSLLGAGLILIFAIAGYFRGMLRILSAFVSLLIAALLARPLSSFFESMVKTLGWIPRSLVPLGALLAAGIAVFLIVFIIAEFLIGRRKRKRLERDLPPMNSWERLGGVVLGGLWGFALTMLLFVGIDAIGQIERTLINASTATTMQTSKPANHPSKKASTIEGQFTALKDGVNRSFFGPFVREVTPVDEEVSRTFQDLAVVLGDPDLLEKFETDPAVARFTKDPRFIAVAQDEEIQRDIQNSNFYALLDNEKIAALLNEKDLFQDLKQVDMRAILRRLIEKSNHEPPGTEPQKAPKE